MMRKILLITLFLLALPVVAPAQFQPGAPAGPGEPQGPGAPADRNVFQDLRDRYKKTKEPPPVDQLFKEAEENYHGKETLLGALVRHIAGKDSTLYKKGKGIIRKNESKALEQYQQLVDSYPFSKYAPTAQLRVADCNYALEKWEEARINYELFLKLHPKSPDVAYALLRQGLCHYKQMLKPGRDQDETIQAAAVFAEVLLRYPGTPEATEAGTKLAECRTRLAKHDLIVADFYFKRKDFWAAAARYRGVWQGYSGLGFDARAQFMEGSCYEGLGKTELATNLYTLAAAQSDAEYSSKARQRLEGLKGKSP